MSSRIGYQAVEILADYPHAFMDGGWTEEDSIKELLRSSGMVVANINANTVSGYSKYSEMNNPFEPSLSNPDPVLRRWRIDYTKRCIDLAVRLGCQSITITSGQDTKTSDDRTKMLGLFIESLKEILEYGERSKVYTGIEYEPGLLVGDAWKTMEVINILKSPYLGVNLDIGHAHVLGESIEEMITMFGPRIISTHIEDIKDRRHFHLIPGLGDIDFVSIINSLKSIDYKHYLIVELYTYADSPIEAGTMALEFLKDKL